MTNSNPQGQEQLLRYQDVLESIKGGENHLLLGNGFNRGLGVNTSYSAIFERMVLNNQGLYKEAKNIFKEAGCDLEKFIDLLLKDVGENPFLRKYIHNKIKLDFMQATHEIVKENIKNVYAEKNEGIYILFQQFTNYFTLNYDSFLYLLLLNFKKSDSSNQGIAMQPTLNFIEDNFGEMENNIYKKIKKARESGVLDLSGFDDIRTRRRLKNLTKTDFLAVISQHDDRSNEKWKKKDVERTVDMIWEEEKRQQNMLAKVDDGFTKNPQKDLLGFDELSIYQNLFFLHGAFHIIQEDGSTLKITQEEKKALYNVLEETLNSGNQDIVCVFQATDKLDLIKANAYLNKCYEKLKTLSGSMVIIGSSLDENDSHIFQAIEESMIETLYISVFEKGKDLERMREKRTSWFPGKLVRFFDAKSISYELSDTCISETDRNLE